jgi:hypothetical protein
VEIENGEPSGGSDSEPDLESHFPHLMRWSEVLNLSTDINSVFYQQMHTVHLLVKN